MRERSQEILLGSPEMMKYVGAWVSLYVAQLRFGISKLHVQLVWVPPPQHIPLSVAIADGKCGGCQFCHNVVAENRKQSNMKTLIEHSWGWEAASESAGEDSEVSVKARSWTGGTGSVHEGIRLRSAINQRPCAENVNVYFWRLE